MHMQIAQPVLASDIFPELAVRKEADVENPAQDFAQLLTLEGVVEQKTSGPLIIAVGEFSGDPALIAPAMEGSHAFEEKFGAPTDVSKWADRSAVLPDQRPVVQEFVGLNDRMTFGQQFRPEGSADISSKMGSVAAPGMNKTDVPDATWAVEGDKTRPRTEEGLPQIGGRQWSTADPESPIDRSPSIGGLSGPDKNAFAVPKVDSVGDTGDTGKRPDPPILTAIEEGTGAKEKEWFDLPSKDSDAPGLGDGEKPRRVLPGTDAPANGDQPDHEIIRAGPDRLIDANKTESADFVDLRESVVRSSYQEHLPRLVQTAVSPEAEPPKLDRFPIVREQSPRSTNAIFLQAPGLVSISEADYQVRIKEDFNPNQRLVLGQSSGLPNPHHNRQVYFQSIEQPSIPETRNSVASSANMVTDAASSVVHPQPEATPSDPRQILIGAPILKEVRPPSAKRFEFDAHPPAPKSESRGAPEIEGNRGLEAKQITQPPQPVLVPSENGEIAGEATAELGVASPAEATSTAVRSEALPIRVEAASRAIPAQMHDIARRLPDGVVEVTLSPEELGRVRVSMQAGESGMTVQITAERPETLELMRRHIDVLAGELRGQGHTGLAFSFAQNGKDHPENETRNQSVPDDNMPDAPLPKTTATLRDAGRLDLRL